MFTLCGRVEGGHEAPAAAFREFVKARGTAAVERAKTRFAESKSTST